MLSFQNRALDINVLKFHVNRDNNAHFGKCNFQRKFVSQFWDHHWIHGIETSQGVVSDPDSESWLALHAKRGNAIVLAFGDKNVIVVMFGWLHLIWNNMWLLLYLVDCISSEMWRNWVWVWSMHPTYKIDFIFFNPWWNVIGITIIFY